MHATTSETRTEQFIQRSSSEREAGADGDGAGKDAGSTPATFGGVGWAAIHLESGNVKVEASASAAEVSCFFFAATSDDHRKPRL